MNFELNDEQRMIYQYGDQLAKTFDQQYWLKKARKNEFPRELWDQVSADGFMGIMVPEQYGGAGLGMTEMSLLMEGMSNNGIPLLSMVVGSTMSLPVIADHGSEAMKQKYLPDACAGKTLFCFAITEPTAGTNTIKINTIAKKKGDKYLLSGAKTFITSADESDYALVVARTTAHTEVDKKTDGFTLFVVDMKAKGVSMTPLEMSVVLPEKQYQLFFDEVELSEDDIIGSAGKGFEVLFESLNPERIVVSAMCIGMGRLALNRAAEYASERVVFNGPIGAYQGLQHPLAAAKTQIELASLMTKQAAWLFDNNKSAGEASSMAKIAAADAGMQAVDAALQCFGGNGFTHDYGLYDMYSVVRLLKTAPINKEMLLNYIAEKSLGMPRSY
ncbi:MAG: acyl-CoA dehydrogenase family protein [Cycloclasticus sp.]|nr:acyl-CoA dehydrogenase family protein [Cycloclasticus sp.]